MKKEPHPIDEFFREALDGYQIAPSEEAKKAFLKYAEGILKNSISIKWWILLLPFAVLIVSIGAFLYLKNVRATGNDKPETYAQKELTKTKNNEVANLPILEEFSSSVHKKEVKQLTTKGYFKISMPIQTNAGSDKKSSENDIRMVMNLLTEEKQAKSIIPASSILPEEIISGQDRVFMPVQNQAPDKPPTEITDTIIKNGVKISGPDTSSVTGLIHNIVLPGPKATHEWRIGTGFYFSPELMFHTIENTKFVTNFGLEGQFCFGRYSIRTGAGISVSKGTNQLLVEYNDYLGSYMKLDSMTFTWDERHYYLLPTYFLSSKDVFDSLMKLDDAKIIKRYTYLQIPIILGYNFIQKEKMSFGFRVGPILSVLLKEKTLSGTYDPGKKQVISINEITPEQINLNWQIMAGLNATFRLSPRIGIEVEPFGKYYFNSVHEPSGGSGKPWSIGLRAAFFISFE